MANPIAVLVDDDPQQLAEASSTIIEAGFKLHSFESVESALPFIEGTELDVDLFVLDRKLPMRTGERAVDELGDELFRIVSQTHSDSRVIVFSGHTDFDHLQSTVQGGGLVFQHGDHRVDRVSVLRKTQFDKFQDAINELRELIARFERIEVAVDLDRGAHQKRVLRRIAHHYGASSISAKALAGGLTGAPVWRCELVSPSGPIADVVAKAGNAIPAAGGLQDLLAREAIARRVEVITGLMGGDVVTILQLAGDSPASLMSLIGSSDARAASATEALCVKLDSLQRLPATSVTLRDLVAQILSWDRFIEQLDHLGLAIPSPEIWLSTASVMSHTDLHASNVLVCDNSPVIIDSDENAYSSALRDPMVLMLSSWVHPDSPWLESMWPSVEDISDHFGDASFAAQSPSPEWYACVSKWIDARTSSAREYWSRVMAYSVRQLRFENVRESATLRGRVEAMVRLAHRHVTES